MSQTISNNFFNGRQTTTKGQQLALSLLNYELQQNGCKGYTNKTNIFPIKTIQIQDINSVLNAKGLNFTYSKDFHYYVKDNMNSGVNYHVVYVGKGGKNDILTALKLHYNPQKENAILITPSNFLNLSSLYKFLNSIQNAYSVKAIFIVNNGYFEMERHNIENTIFKNPTQSKWLNIDYSFYDKTMLPTIFVTQNFWNKIFAETIKKINYEDYLYKEKSQIDFYKINPITIYFQAKFKKQYFNIANAIGVYNNFDPKKENIIVSTSYDGIQNTSSSQTACNTAVLLALLKIYHPIMNKIKLDKNLIFIFYVGKYQNNIGARTYAKAPLFPHMQTFLHISINGVNKMDDTNTIFYAQTSKNYLLNHQKVIQSIHQKCKSKALRFLDNNQYMYYSDAFQIKNCNIPFIEFIDSKNESKNYLGDYKEINYSVLDKRLKYLTKFIWNALNSKETAKNMVDRKAIILSTQMRP